MVSEMRRFRALLEDSRLEAILVILAILVLSLIVVARMKLSHGFSLESRCFARRGYARNNQTEMKERASPGGYR
jgi:hypothetical protein